MSINVRENITVMGTLNSFHSTMSLNHIASDNNSNYQLGVLVEWGRKAKCTVPGLLNESLASLEIHQHHWGSSEEIPILLTYASPLPLSTPPLDW